MEFHEWLMHGYFLFILWMLDTVKRGTLFSSSRRFSQKLGGTFSSKTGQFNAPSDPLNHHFKKFHIVAPGSRTPLSAVIFFHFFTKQKYFLLQKFSKMIFR